MIARHAIRPLLLAAGLLLTADVAFAQGTSADYRRALGLAETYEGLVTNVADNVQWIGNDRVSFRRSVAGGHEDVVLDIATLQERPAAEGERARPGQRFGGGQGFGGGGNGGSDVRVSPDGRTEALIRNYNLAVRAVGSEDVRLLSHDGSEGNAYALGSISWSPDSRRLAAYRVIPGYERLVHYVESSPDGQLQPLHSTRSYTKPGDMLDVRQPVLFDVASGAQAEVDNALFSNAYSLSNLAWREDGRAFTFEYNGRGHEVYRVISVDGRTGQPRAMIDEDPETFFYYRNTSGDGKLFRHDMNDGREVIWMSERDGWSHLYLFDGETGRVKNQITRGDWVVRDVEHVDEANRQIYFMASGMNPDQDPYFVHYYRINFDGTGLTPLTEANGTHDAVFSDDMQHYVVTWSRVDMPPVTELRRTRDGKVLAELGRGDHAALLAAGWRAPEPFTAKGRDGVTDIWGIILRPSNFDPSKKYPVIESIYAGPHSNHVPKSFSVLPSRGMMAQAELGFIVVQIDGMGTSNRSKAFHDVAWKNLGDAGFPDRILWHKAVAAKYPFYDTSRVGIYGGSAGGQNAMGALLFHPDFYHAAVADNGCHDNRMDKIWWNELWMGYPLGDHYDRASNVVNAHRLQGKLLLTVSELDTNVDPSSTYQVVDALIKAGKEFDLLVVPGGEHARGPYHERKRFDFFVENLLGVEPPLWNQGGVLAAPGADN